MNEHELPTSACLLATGCRPAMSLNANYSGACQGRPDDPVPDCGHHDCGLLCDHVLLQERPAAQRRPRAAAEGQRRAPSVTTPHVRAERLLREGRRSYRQVARITGLPLSTVASMAQRLDLRRTVQRYGEDHAAAVARLRQENHSLRSIASELGIPRSTVQRIAVRSGVPSVSAYAG